MTILDAENVEMQFDFKSLVLCLSPKRFINTSFVCILYFSSLKGLLLKYLS